MKYVATVRDQLGRMKLYYVPSACQRYAKQILMEKFGNYRDFHLV